MIIDAHMHLCETMLGVPGCPAHALMAEMQACGVRAAWAMTVEGFYGETRKWNEWLLTQTQSCGGFYVPFCTVDPKAGDAAVEELEYFVRERGMRGLKIHNWLQAVSTTVPGMEELVAACGRLDVPLLVHDGSPPYCTPLQFARLAERHPETTLILGHMGLKDMWPDAIRAAARLDKMLLCACGAPLVAVREAVKRIGASRILFGSDCGGVGSEKLLEERILALRSLRAIGVSEADIESRLFGNAQRCLPMG